MKSNLVVIAECGMLLAASLALSQIKLFSLPQGGSVSLGSFPILLLAARRGAGIGTAAGVLLGILLVSQKPFVVNPVQFLLDYPLAYGALGLAGLRHWDTSLKAAIGAILGNSIRLIFHVIAGAFFFLDKNLPTINILTASLVYNIGHMLPETVICTFVAVFLVTKHPDLTARQ